MGTLMLQSGELATRTRLHYLERVVAACREATVAQEMEQRGLDAKARPGAGESAAGPAAAAKQRAGCLRTALRHFGLTSSHLAACPAWYCPGAQPQPRPSRHRRMSRTRSVKRWACASRCRWGSCRGSSIRFAPQGRAGEMGGSLRQLGWETNRQTVHMLWTGAGRTDAEPRGADTAGGLAVRMRRAGNTAASLSWGPSPSAGALRRRRPALSAAH
jgi:hypothetical protein